MTNPLFWLGLSLLFVTLSLAVVLIVMIPTLRELARAARSAEKLFETLRREFPPTLEAIRLTGMEITDLTEDISEGVQSAGQVAKQVDQTLTGARKQVRKVQLNTRSLMTGVKTAWKTFTRSQPPQPRRKEQLPPAKLDSEPLADPNGTRFISKAGEVIEENQTTIHTTDERWVEEPEARRRD
ncbi:MAG: DUF948 domain-containing protein [Leptolyngbyaceae cyanobacterium bins.302]|nr:DUF948 domain-containing protein [Leptolyngbyaceae cyanobacterium bins.302]